MKATWYLFLALASMASSSAWGAAPAADRAATYKVALALAKQSGQDIVVYQRGSDWSHLGELLLAEVWNRSEFAEAVGSGAILVVVDNPESAGSAPTSKQAPEDAQPNEGAPPPSPCQRLREVTDESHPLPADEIERVDSDQGSVFKRRGDGCFTASGAAPAGEVLTLTIKPAHAGRVLRVDFPLDESLPGRGPGRAANGNFAVSELEVGAMHPAAAWANASEGALGAWQAIDGVSDQGDNAWNPAAHDHHQRTLLVALDKTAPADKPLIVRLICKSQWGQHVPGCISAAVLAEPSVEADVLAVGKAEREIADNAQFAWRGVCVPRIALMDREGRPVAADDRPRQGLTPAALAQRVHEMQALRIRRDALWAEGQRASGPRRAELDLDGLLALGDEIAFDGAYKFMHDQIRAADPKDESACGRRLMFPPESRTVPPMVAEAYKLVDEKKYAEAIARLDSELEHPGNRRLSHEHIQRLMNGKFNVYRRWPEHEEMRFDVQREIYKFDPTTFWGLGAIGYLAMHERTSEPVALCYGWAPCHLKPGMNAWTFALDIRKYFDHAGAYTLRIMHKGGKDSVRIVRVKLMDGDVLLSEAAPSAALSPKGKVEINVAIPNWPPRSKLSLRLEVEAEDGKTDARGGFEVDPLL